MPIKVLLGVLYGDYHLCSYEYIGWTDILAYSLIYLFTAAYGVSFGPVAWVLPTEVFPLSLRSKGAAISTASNWFNNCK
jgi:hypothetical protein